MKICVYSLALMILLSNIINNAQNAPFSFRTPLFAPIPVPHHGGVSKFIMCTDYDEKVVADKGAGALTCGLMAALNYREAIVFTTYSLLFNILYCQRLVHDFATLEHAALKEKYQQEYRAFGKENAQQFKEFAQLLESGNATTDEGISLYNELYNGANVAALDTYIACTLIKFDQFYVFKADTENYFCLFVPKSLIAGATISPVAGDQITDLEFKIGLKINHLQSLDINSVGKKTAEPTKESAQTETFKSLFVTTQDYEKNKKQSLEPLRIFVVDGHGSPSGIQNVYIAGIKITQLAQMMHFMEDLLTGIVSLLSCYSAGQNLVDLTNSINQLLSKEKRITYIVTSNALSENVTGIYQLTIDLSHQGIRIVGNPDYVTYFNLVSQTKPDLIRALNVLAAPAFSNDLTTVINPYNIPVISFPGAGLMSAVNLIGTVAIIDESTIANQPAQQALNIEKQFGKNNKKPDAILLYVANIPFSLTIDYRLSNEKRIAPHFLSLIPGSAAHKIKEVNMPLIGGQEFLESLAFYPIQGAKKLLWFEKVITSSGTLENVVFYNKPNENGDSFEHTIYYTQNNQFYRKRKELKEAEEAKGLSGYNEKKLSDSYIPDIEKEIEAIVKE